jgi:hypothetical protein
VLRRARPSLACKHRDVRLHCFYDRPGAPTVEEIGPNLTFHQLDMVPLEGHDEQRLNALDGELSGVAISIPSSISTR